MRLSRRKSWIVLGAMWIASGTFLFVRTADENAPGLRLVVCYGITLVAVAITLPVTRALIAFSCRRALAKQLRPGVEVTSRFGPTSVEMSLPLSRSEMSYEGFTWTRRSGDWFFFRHGGSRVVQVCPGSLFPDDQLTRLPRAAGHSTT